MSSRKGTIEFEGSPEYGEGDLRALRAVFAELGSPPDLQGKAAICGNTTAGPCTLLNPLRLVGGGKADLATMQTWNRTRYRATRTVMGLHIESSKASVIDGAAYHFTKIYRLLPDPWHTNLTKDGMEHTFSSRTCEVFRFTSDYLQSEIVCEVRPRGGVSAKRGVQITSAPRIAITPKLPQSMDWFTALAFRLENFFSLILGTSVDIKHVQLFHGEKDGWVVQRVNGRKEKIDRQTWVRCKIEETANALERWVAIPQEDQLVELSMLGALRKSTLYPQTEFLTLAQTLEGFGRIRFGGAKRREVKFDDMIDETYSLFSSGVAQQVVGNRETFKSKILQTRDYYTHIGNPKGGSAAKTEKELFLLNKRLHAFIRGAMLADLGISEDAFFQAIIYQATMWR